MNRGCVAFVVSLAVATVPAATLAQKLPATGGDIEVTPLMHGSVQVSHAGKVIAVDPWSQGDLSRGRPADLILITDDQSHHLDPAGIQKVRKPGTPVVIPAAGKQKVPDGTVLLNGEARNIAGISVESVAMYDLIPGDPFHPKGRGNGYVITLGGKRLYFAGVTECTTEMQALKNIDVAFMPMNLPQGRMKPPAVAECLRILKPKVVYPYHYDQDWMTRVGSSGGPAQNVAPTPAAAESLKELQAQLKGLPIDLRLGPWYPAPGTR